MSRQSESTIADALRAFDVVTVRYSRAIARDLAELYEVETDATVYLVPWRSDTRWWRDLCRGARRLVNIKGRVRFGGHKQGAPFPSGLVYRGSRLDEFTEAARALGDVWALYRTKGAG